MNDKNAAEHWADDMDPKIAQDWAEVEARRAEITSRDEGDARRQAIMKRLRILKAVS